MRYLLILLCLLSAAWCQTKGKKAATTEPDSTTSALDESWDPATLLEMSLDPGHADRDLLRPDQYERFLKGGNPEVPDINARVNGYRVQLIATRNESEARSNMENALSFFPERVYLLFDSPFYKLRVGDCVLRSDADSLQQRAIHRGFSSAWIIASQVFLHPPQQENFISMPVDTTRLQP